MSRMRTALDWHTLKLIESSGENVFFAHSGTSYSMKASVGKTPWYLDNGGGVQVISETRDFLIKKSEMPFDPERGDKITDAVGDEYEVGCPGEGIPWRFVNSTNTLVRVFTIKAG